jgi:hypothetical protein
MAVERMRTFENVGELARELGVRPRCLYKRRAKLERLEPGEEAALPSTLGCTQLLSHFFHCEGLIFSGLYLKIVSLPKPKSD